MAQFAEPLMKAVLFCISLSACSGAGGKVVHGSEVEPAVGRRVRVVGTAANAKLSAIVLVDERPIYLLGRAHWSEEELGDTVEFDCVLKKTEHHKMRTVDGVPLQGTDGAIVFCEPPGGSASQ